MSLSKVFKLPFILLKVILPLAFVIILGAVVILMATDLQGHHTKVEHWLKTQHNIDLDLEGKTKLSVSAYKPALSVETVRYGGVPPIITGQGVKLQLDDFFKIKESVQHQQPIDLRLTAGGLETSGLSFADVTLPLTIDQSSDAWRTPEPLTADVYGARLSSVFEEKSGRLYQSGTLNGLKLSQFNPDLDVTLDTQASLSGQLGDLLIPTLAGEVVIRSGKGSLLGNAVNLWGGDLLLNLLPGGKKNTEVICAVAPFKVERGIASTEGIIINTTRVVILGKGSIDLNAWTMNFTLKAQPKSASLVNLSAPIRIRGALDNPNVSVSKKALAKKVGGIIASAINPATLLYSFSTVGTDISDDACFKSVENEIKE